MTEHDIRRRRILSAARLCFSTQSYDRVDFQDVAWGASLSPDEVRDLFPDKGDLFDAVLDDCLTGDVSSWLAPEILAILLRSLADPSTATIAAERMRRTGLGHLGTHHLAAAAKVLGAPIREVIAG